VTDETEEKKGKNLAAEPASKPIATISIDAERD